MYFIFQIEKELHKGKQTFYLTCYLVKVLRQMQNFLLKHKSMVKFLFDPQASQN